jgi:hypothetical protein
VAVGAWENADVRKSEREPFRELSCLGDAAGRLVSGGRRQRLKELRFAGGGDALWLQMSGRSGEPTGWAEFRLRVM